MKTIADIEDVNLKDCFFSKNEYGEKFVTLSFYNRNFHHSFFRESPKGSYIVFKGKRYYYPFNGNKFLI